MGNSIDLERTSKYGVIGGTMGIIFANASIFNNRGGPMDDTLGEYSNICRDGEIHADAVSLLKYKSVNEMCVVAILNMIDKLIGLYILTIHGEPNLSYPHKASVILQKIDMHFKILTHEFDKQKNNASDIEDFLELLKKIEEKISIYAENIHLDISIKLQNNQL